MSMGEVFIYTETFGTVGANTPIASHGFDNGDLIYTGTGDIRGTTVSSGYAGASGGANVFLGAGQYFMVGGLNTASYESEDLWITFGAYKSLTSLDMSDLIFSYSVDGENFIALAVPVQPTGSGTANWRLIGPLSGLPSSESLWLKWEHAGTAGSYRLDDIQIHAVPEPATWGIILGILSVLYMLFRKLNSACVC